MNYLKNEKEHDNLADCDKEVATLIRIVVIAGRFIVVSIFVMSLCVMVFR
jgi:hypothetical protein